MFFTGCIILSVVRNYKLIEVDNERKNEHEKIRN